MATWLTSEEAASYERLGFLSPLRALNPDEAAGYRARLEEFERQVGGPITSDKVDGKYRYRLHTLLPWAHELATLPRVLDVIDPEHPENGAIVQIEHEIRSCVTPDGSKYKSCPLREV